MCMNTCINVCLFLPHHMPFNKMEQENVCFFFFFFFFLLITFYYKNLTHAYIRTYKRTIKWLGLFVLLVYVRAGDPTCMRYRSGEVNYVYGCIYKCKVWFCHMSLNKREEGHLVIIISYTHTLPYIHSSMKMKHNMVRY